jgi:DNA-binding LacI/PurR family transcriptional regulator
VTGRSRTLGVVSFDTTLYGPASTLFGIERAAHEAGYSITIVSVAALDRESVRDAVERLRRQGVDGILVIAPRIGAADALLDLPADMPLVAVEGGPGEPVPVVAVDNVRGAAIATRHLLDLGHRTIGHLAGPADWMEAQQRIEGWRSTLLDAGAEESPPLIGDWSAHSGYELGQRLAQDRDITAVFAANDQMALGLLRALHEAGREIPRDISVVGFDDIPEAEYFTPPLTTVRQDFGELGHRSLRRLLDVMDDGTRPASSEAVTPELIIRASTARAASRPR